jgi:hypothetical protein
MPLLHDNPAAGKSEGRAARRGPGPQDPVRDGLTPDPLPVTAYFFFETAFFFEAAFFLVATFFFAAGLFFAAAFFLAAGFFFAPAFLRAAGFFFAPAFLRAAGFFFAPTFLRAAGFFLAAAFFLVAGFFLLAAFFFDAAMVISVLWVREAVYTTTRYFRQTSRYTKACPEKTPVRRVGRKPPLLAHTRIFRQGFRRLFRLRK